MICFIITFASKGYKVHFVSYVRVAIPKEQSGVFTHQRIKSYPAKHDNPTFTISVAPDQMASEDQDLHCLSSSCKLNEYFTSSNLTG